MYECNMALSCLSHMLAVAGSRC